MFKYVHKITPYLDESRIDNRLSKKNRNCRYKDKVLYINDETILMKDIKNNKFYYKYCKYVINDSIILISINNRITNNLYYLKTNISYRKFDKPAIIAYNGSKAWFLNGKHGRLNDKPVVVCSNGTKCWYVNGKLHRDNDKPAIVCSNDNKYWYVN